jgi:hypothetical protein
MRRLPPWLPPPIPCEQGKQQGICEFSAARATARHQFAQQFQRVAPEFPDQSEQGICFAEQRIDPSEQGICRDGLHGLAYLP